MNERERARVPHAHPFDRTTLTAIYDDYHQPIYRYIYRQVGEVETARDLTAEVFQRFLQAIQKGQGPDRKLAAWLYRTAHNAVVDHYRRQQYRQHLPLDEKLVDAGDDPVKLAESHISAEGIRLALQRLTPDQRQVIILKFLEELSNEEVATLLDKPVGAIKSLQHRALAALQRHLTSTKEKVLP